MSTLPHWDRDFESWDVIKLDNKRLPGVWEVEDGNVKRVVDIKKSKGRDGATIKDEGYENGRFRLVGQIVSEDDWEEMQKVISAVHPKKKGKERKPFRIEAVALNALGVFLVHVIEVSVPRLDNGIMTVTLEVLEYVAHPAKVKKPAGTPTGPIEAPGDKTQSFEPPDALLYTPSTYSAPETYNR